MKFKPGIPLAILVKGTKLLKLIKTIKFLKVFWSAMSIAIFTICQSAMMGLVMSIGFVFLILLHELGHIIALKQKGFGTKLPIFIPFVGAAIFIPNTLDREQEAYVGCGGPILGTLVALLVAIPYFFHPVKFWLALSNLGILINLFNMTPIRPLDGGRIIQATDARIRYLGLSILLFLTLFLGDPGMGMLWILVLQDLNFSKKITAILASVVLSGMVFLSLIGVHAPGQPHWALWIDCGASALIVGVYWLAAIYLRGTDINMDNRTLLPQKQRIGWAVLWIGLALVQVGILWTLTHLLR